MSVRIAVEGCCHGALNQIYRSVPKDVELLLICGDFQAFRNSADLKSFSAPEKYRQMMDFHEYYSGKKKAPVLTIFIGGNHEASSYLRELQFGGWVAPSIYYLGEYGTVWYKGLRISGTSGIFNYASFVSKHNYSLPYDRSAIRSIYHVKPKNFVKQLLTGHCDIVLSHDWPQWIWERGNVHSLLRHKKYFKTDIKTGRLGSPLAMEVLKYLRPRYWFSSHLHTRFTAEYKHRQKRKLSGSESSSKEDVLKSDERDGNEISDDVLKSDEKDGNEISDKTRDVLKSDERDVNEISLDMDNENEILLDMDKNSDNEEIPLDMDKNSDNEEIPLEMDKNSDNEEIPLVMDKNSDNEEIPLDMDKNSDNEEIPSNMDNEEIPRNMDNSEIPSNLDDPSVPENPSKPFIEAVAKLLTKGTNQKSTSFLALDKCLPKRKFLEIMTIKTDTPSSDSNLYHDPRAIAIHRVVEKASKTSQWNDLNPKNMLQVSKLQPLLDELDDKVQVELRNVTGELRIPRNFKRIAPPSHAPEPKVQYWDNNQTNEFCAKFNIPKPDLE